jgi:hypothetical protein
MPLILDYEIARCGNEILFGHSGVIDTTDPLPHIISVKVIDLV